MDHVVGGGCGVGWGCFVGGCDGGGGAGGVFCRRHTRTTPNNKRLFYLSMSWIGAWIMKQQPGVQSLVEKTKWQIITAVKNL